MKNGGKEERKGIGMILEDIKQKTVVLVPGEYITSIGTYFDGFSLSTSMGREYQFG